MNFQRFVLFQNLLQVSITQMIILKKVLNLFLIVKFFLSFFQCDALDDGLLSEEDEEDYDALNDETFGESVISK